jgi:hypothetical protein
MDDKDYNKFPIFIGGSVDSLFGLFIHHAIMLLLCFLIMANRYLNPKDKYIASIVLNLLITVVIVNLGLQYGMVSAIISIFLYLIYMIIMNKLILYIAGKIDKSDTLLKELKKKIYKNGG